MTGWQSGDGGQGGWHQNQPFGPESQTNRYGADPYANPYGADPGANPYAQPYGSDPYGGGGYDPYQQYPPTGGFPAPGFGPPPMPPKRSKLPMILSIVAIVIIIGAVVTIVLVNRDSSPPVAQDDDRSSTTTTTSDTEKSTSGSSGSPTTSSGGGGGRDDWRTIDNSQDSGLIYQVPPDWAASDSARTSGLNVDFTGAADYGVYECEGSQYVRTFAASGDVQGKDGQDLDVATTLEDFATSFAKTYYGTGATADIPTPTETEIDGKAAMTLTAKVTQQVTKPNCQASEGEIALVGVPLETEGEPAGVAMLVVINDLNGGPADPKALAPSVTQEILSTVRIG